jgi:ribonuclease HII
MLIMPGMNRQTRQATGRAQNGGKQPASTGAVRKDARKDGGKAPGKDAAPRLPLGEEIITRPTFRRERAALKRGVWPIAGCDEAGRGPLAGPVVAAAVILDPDNIPRGLDDSKRLTPERRAVLYERICARAQVAVALAPPARIDRDNILRASLWALARAVAALPVKPALVFVDGRDRIAAGCDCQAVIGGDGLVASIAAASIVAKVTRDRLMACLGAAHPGYGFERHMGYSVPEHFEALDRLGPTIHHRRSFSPVAIALGELGLSHLGADADDVIADVLPL